MFNFFKKNRNFLEELKVDIHSHLLPEIDDGVKTIEDSIFLIQELQKIGYKKLIITPHIIEDSYPNTKEIIIQKLQEVKKRVIKENITISIEAAAEHYLDELFLNNLKAQKTLPINKEYLLFETSYISKPLDLEDLIYEIYLAGYKPLLAHPERYRYIKDLEKEYKRLKDLGVYFQVNLNSFKGYYGKEARKKSQFLMQKGYIDFLGSDMHHLRHLQYLKKVGDDYKLYERIIQKNKILNSTLL